MRRERFRQADGRNECSPVSEKCEESNRYRVPMSPSAWREAVRSTEHELAGVDQEKIQSSMHQITWGIEWLDPFMTRYCRETCPSCEDPCCTGHKVFFNQADLLYLSALRSSVPPGQTRSSPKQTCRYLGDRGCRLSRFHRPYVCVWFLCDAQMRLLSREPNHVQRRFIRTLQNIRLHRLALESLYERHISRS